jgi:hypothetical protein
MLKTPGFAVRIGSIYLVIYCICLSSESLYSFAWLLFALYPLLLLWIIFSILRPGDYQVKELDGEEFGYGDKPKDLLGMF